MTSTNRTAEFADALVLDESAYLRFAQNAVSLKERITAIADEAHKGGIRRLAFVGAGGTWANTLWLSEVAERSGSSLPVDSFVAAELTASQDPRIDDGTLVVVNSVTGTTEDVIAAVDFSKARGARVVVFAPEPESPLALAADWFVKTEGSFRGFEVYLLVLTTRLLGLRGDIDYFDRLYSELDALPAALLDVVKTTDPVAEAFALAHTESDYIFLIGSGLQWGITYNYSMCVIEEAFWIRTTRVTSAEFFHGSLELIQEHTPVLVLEGEDYTRQLDERAIAFVRRYTDDVTVIDTASYALEGVSADLRPLLSNVVLNHATRRFSLYLQHARNHGLDSRQYYRKVQY